ncbi:MAG: hypothetical protein JNM58_19710 [Xanthomonadaceae bacterium]|nr:hypothetical protein [Xanthomonadaceae bacterium]
MLKILQPRPIALVLMAAGNIPFIPFALGQSTSCGCPDDGHGAPRPSIGLGQSFPSSIDLAADPSWMVYGFQRDGVDYFQINDANGVVHAAIGAIDGTYWTLPLGVDADRVVLPGDTGPSGTGRTLYVSNDIEIVLHQSTNGTYWVIRQPTQSE